MLCVRKQHKSTPPFTHLPIPIPTPPTAFATYPTCISSWFCLSPVPLKPEKEKELQVQKDHVEFNHLMETE